MRLLLTVAVHLLPHLLQIQRTVLLEMIVM